MKVLITGSRNWTNEGAIRRELSKLPQGTRIIHGGCRTGADAIADRVAAELGFILNVYPEDWSIGKAAGPIRNSRMIKEEHEPDDPIDLCLAFTLDVSRSRGTRDCVAKARAAGIPVEVFSL
jgi:hypothetical protein